MQLLAQDDIDDAYQLCSTTICLSYDIKAHTKSINTIFKYDL